MTVPNITVNVWVTVIVVFLTLVAILLFRPEIYMILLSGILEIIKALSNFEMPNINLGG